jgi:hypothetical protein
VARVWLMNPWSLGWEADTLTITLLAIVERQWFWLCKTNIRGIH